MDLGLGGTSELQRGQWRHTCPGGSPAQKGGRRRPPTLAPVASQARFPCDDHRSHLQTFQHRGQKSSAGWGQRRWGVSISRGQNCSLGRRTSSGDAWGGGCTQYERASGQTTVHLKTVQVANVTCYSTTTENIMRKRSPRKIHPQVVSQKDQRKAWTAEAPGQLGK